MTKDEFQAKVEELEVLAKNKFAKTTFYVGCAISFIIGFIVKAVIF
ncbi:hypothetical protein [Bacteroides sp.]|nr:hypothetical protein [Bacteroides sp.]MDD3039744.1 hypothetical protein [Bacteroides sp.]